MGVSVEGRFRKWKASVDWRPDDLAHSKADFEIDLASIDLASEESEAEVRRPGWFDTAKFPRAAFRSSALRRIAEGRYEIAGDLTIKGTTRPLSFPVTVRRDATGNSIAEGEFTLQRLAFNIGEGPWADPSVVANDVVVRVRMVLPRAA
jgi:polyisoprenoid-binding protein YceI